MGNIVQTIGNLVTGVLGGGAPKADRSASTATVDTAAERARTARSKLIETGGYGDALQPGEVSAPSDTIYGN